MALNDTIEKLNNVLKLLSDEGAEIIAEKTLVETRTKELNQKETELKSLREDITKKMEEQLKIQKSMAEENKRDNDNIEQKIKELETRSPQIEERIGFLLQKETQIKNETAKLNALLERTKDLAEREEKCEKQLDINAKETEYLKTQRVLLDEKEKMNAKERERLQTIAVSLNR